MHPEIIKTLLICGTTIFALIFFAVGSKFRWFRNLSIGRNGLQVQAAEREKEKQYQSGNLEHLLRDHIQKCDVELMDFALEKATMLRRSISIELNKDIGCSSMRKALSSSLRYPLLHAAMRNNFKYVLRPENIKFYIERLMKEINFEYEEFAIEHAISYCKVDDNKKCPELPLWESMSEVLVQRLLNDWALLIKQKNIDICHKKIDLYRNFIKSFEELGDTVKVKVAEHCIDKNREYIEAFVRKPELREN
jgi:hypothetical protein